LVGNVASTEQELIKTQDDLRVARYSLTNSQSQVAQLTELTAQLEGQIASTEQELSKTQQELEELEASFEALEAASKQHKQALMQADVEKTRLMEHAAAVEAHLRGVEQRKAEITSDLEQARENLEQSKCLHKLI
jgi:chromosome segregation ATPase